MTAQQLKNSILQMAVQGKLVPQDPNDEPASVLLERIRAEKEQMIKEGKIKKEKNPSYIFRGTDNLPYEKIGDNDPVCIADEVPFDIPKNWEWVRLKNLFNVVSARRVHQSDWRKNGVPFYRAREIGKLSDNGEVNNELFIDEELYNELSKSGVPSPNDIMVTAVGTLGKAYIVKNTDHFYYKDASVICLENFSHTLPEYMLLVMQSPYMQDQIKGASFGTTVGTITIIKANEYFIPFPPLAEQKRIVEKINTLSPFIRKCVEEENAVNLLNTDFPEQLKKSILQQAIQGKLVPQDPTDEPASALLERIRVEKERLIKEGKTKRDKHESVIFRRDNSHYELLDGVERCIDDEIPFDIPDSWEWARLGNILYKLSDGTHSTPKYVLNGIPFISVKDISNGKLTFNNCKYISYEEHKELYSRCNPEIGDILLTKVGTTGIPVIVDTNNAFSLFVSVALLKFNQSLLYNKFLIHLINSPLVQKQAEENTRGVGNKNWVMRDIANTLVVVPPIEEQYRIATTVDELFEVIRQI